MTTVGIPTEMMSMHDKKELLEACELLRPYKQVFIKMKIEEYLQSGSTDSIGDYCNKQIAVTKSTNSIPSILG